jgi:hypothetical protein
MAVKGVIFDVSDTLVAASGAAASGVRAALDRLRNLDVAVVAVSTHPARQSLARAGIDVDLLVTKADVKANKGNPVWIDFIKERTGLQTNELIYVGDSDLDMRTAANSHMVYVHAVWAASHGRYGIPAPTPDWVAAVVEHIFRKQHHWYWSLDTQDRDGHRVRTMALIDGNGAGDSNLKNDLIAVLKREESRKVGRMELRDFLVLHLIASLYGEGLTEEVDWWTTYPGRQGQRKQALGSLLEYGAKLFRDKYQPDLFVRHSPAIHSRDARSEGGLLGAIRNQVDTIHLNPALHSHLVGRKVLTIDDFVTDGPTTEVARNMLLAGGSADVINVGIGKYGPNMNVLTLKPGAGQAWNIFAATPQYDNLVFEHRPERGYRDMTALNEFLQSRNAIAGEPL